MMESHHITEFLLARIAEDEAVARAATPGPWRTDGTAIGGARHQPVVKGGFDSAGSLQDACAPWDAEHIAHWNPARVLAECEAKRRIVELHQSWPVLVESPPVFEATGRDSDVNSMTFRASQQIQWLTQDEYRKRFGSEPPTAPMLAAMAAVYADHPDYREEEG